MTIPAEGALLEPELLKELERLSLLNRKIRKGAVRGEQPVRRIGSGVEFHDYRGYRPGDEIKRIDWNLFARLDRLFIKLYAGEESQNIYLLIDSSASMGFGNPPKLEYAKRIAAALGYIGVMNLDRVGVVAFDGDGVIRFDPQRLKNRVSVLFSRIASITPGGTTALGGAIPRFAKSVTKPGLAVLVSDFFESEGWRRALAALAHTGFDCMAVQVLAPEEAGPEERGAAVVIDSETGARHRLVVDRRVQESYSAELEAHCSRIQGVCLRRGIEYVRVFTTVPLAGLLLQYLRQGTHLR